MPRQAKGGLCPDRLRGLCPDRLQGVMPRQAGGGGDAQTG